MPLLRARPMEEFDISNTLGHLVAGSAVLTTVAGILPPAVALVALVWYVIQIYESRTFQHWFRNRQMKSQAKRLARLRAREKVTLAKIEALETVRAAKAEAREKVKVAGAEAEKLVVKEAVETAAKLPPV
jgi:hypothetical protein